MPSRHPPLGPGPRPRPQQTRSITVEQEGPNRPVQGRLIPWPEVPCYPIHDDLSLIAPARMQEARQADGVGSGGLFAISRPLFTTAGKTGLAWSFKALGLEPDAEVLMPAYHCMAMIEPLPWLGLKPRFYRLNEDLSIDYEALEAGLDKSCKALVAVHYFGFPEDGQRLRAFCDAFGLALIEDCCHSFFGAGQGQALGSFGDYAVGSLPKFFPLQSGGCVVSARREMPGEDLSAPGRIADLQSFARELQTAHYYGRLRSMNPLALGGAVLTKILLRLGMGREMAKLYDSPESLKFAASRFAGKLQSSSDLSEMARQRRRNYEAVCRALTDLPGVTLMKPALEDGVVPYMVPLRIPALRRVFAELENQAVPMQRFGQFLAPELDEAFCPVSSDLSHHGLQLPCHQNLLPEEIDWTVERLRDICHRAQVR